MVQKQEEESSQQLCRRKRGVWRDRDAASFGWGRERNGGSEEERGVQGSQALKIIIIIKKPLNSQNLQKSQTRNAKLRPFTLRSQILPPAKAPTSLFCTPRRIKGHEEAKRNHLDDVRSSTTTAAQKQGRGPISSNSTDNLRSNRLLSR